MAQNVFHAVVVHVRFEAKDAEVLALFIGVDVPPRETASDFLYIVLRVVPRAQGVEFHQFACVVLIRRGDMIGDIVEVHEHGPASGAGA